MIIIYRMESAIYYCVTTHVFMRLRLSSSSSSAALQPRHLRHPATDIRLLACLSFVSSSQPQFSCLASPLPLSRHCHSRHPIWVSAALGFATYRMLPLSGTGAIPRLSLPFPVDRAISRACTPSACPSAHRGHRPAVCLVFVDGTSGTCVLSIPRSL